MRYIRIILLIITFIPEIIYQFFSGGELSKLSEYIYYKLK